MFLVLCIQMSSYITLRGVKMTPLVLLILGMSRVFSDSHYLRYYYTATSEKIPELPLYISVGYMDDKEITKYSSDVGRVQPMVQWMENNTDKQFWDEETRIGKNNEAVFKHNVKTAMSRFNQTGGFHMFQYMYGCELRDDGSTVGYLQDVYDGKEFLYLDTERGIFIPTMYEAQMSTQRWNSPELNWGQIWKIYLQNTCIESLKRYIEYGREDLEKRVRPEVKVWGRHQSNGVTRLQCLVYGFQPRAVDVKWMRNGVDYVLSDEMSPILPHPDGTYQTRVSAEVPTRDGDTYSCHVDHSSLGSDILSVKWVPPTNGFLTVIICIICIVVVVGIAVVLAVLRKKRKHGYKDTNTSDISSLSSNNQRP